ncbi:MULTISPECIES: YraN family protein [unclassified Aureispira]|uniref:YraN family protein n=1 Tax=unclassified Aureispira TaxID=2649989 RepID=UPI0006988A92|nr:MULTISPECIES: YraN family protein [unclassified Aureispira]WMX12810.1 YraN family protein [Aureispira sp. CCB-E]
MANHNDVGKLGEQIAKKHLKGAGYTILEHSWRWGKGEIDFIAQLDHILVFVEVKTRKKAIFGLPEEAVSSKKQNLMYELAVEYMYQAQYEAEFRFDVISIILEPQLEICHFEDAFFPNWS